MAVKTYLFNINECGQTFCAVRARDAEHALDMAEKKFIRRAADYNMNEGDEPIEVEWWAHPGEDAAANARSAHRMIKVPND